MKFATQRIALNLLKNSCKINVLYFRVVSLRAFSQQGKSNTCQNTSQIFQKLVITSCLTFSFVPVTLKEYFCCN